jgi:tRNA 2-thiouridine synthesizing protein A
MKFDEELDLRGIPCPANAAKAMLKLSMMDSGEILKVIIDNGEPVENVPSALSDEGHAILEQKSHDEKSTYLIVKAS